MTESSPEGGAFGSTFRLTGWCLSAGHGFVWLGLWLSAGALHWTNSPVRNLGLVIGFIAGLPSILGGLGWLLAAAADLRRRHRLARLDEWAIVALLASSYFAIVVMCTIGQIKACLERAGRHNKLMKLTKPAPSRMVAGFAAYPCVGLTKGDSEDGP